jgi:hypothetical protein
MPSLDVNVFFTRDDAIVRAVVETITLPFDLNVAAVLALAALLVTLAFFSFADSFIGCGVEDR